MDVDLLINNGKLVIPAYIIFDIGIKREKIAAIATDLSGFPAKKPSLEGKTGQYALGLWHSG